MDRLREWAATCFYLGEVPFAPGTAASLGAVAIYLLAALRWEGRSLSIFAGVAGVVLALVGIALGRWAQEYYKQRDPNEFVLDEAAGMLVALVGVTPTVWALRPWKAALAAFLFFRLLDIVKPFPVGRSERLRGGWGIVLDDIVAGIYAAGCVHVYFHYL